MVLRRRTVVDPCKFRVSIQEQLYVPGTQQNQFCGTLVFWRYFTSQNTRLWLHKSGSTIQNWSAWWVPEYQCSEPLSCCCLFKVLGNFRITFLLTQLEGQPSDVHRPDIRLLYDSGFELDTSTSGQGSSPKNLKEKKPIRTSSFSNILHCALAAERLRWDNATKMHVKNRTHPFPITVSSLRGLEI